MKLNRIAIEGEHGFPGLDLKNLPAGLAVLVGEAPGELSSLAEMTTHLLFGSPCHAAAPTRWLRGDVYVTTRRGDVRLSRRGAPEAPQVTAARRVGAESAPASPAEWLAGAPLGVVTTILNGWGMADPRAELEGLLSHEVAVAIRRLTPSESAVHVDDSDLLRRRDELALRIESRLGEQRGESEQLRLRLEELEETRQRLRDEVEQLGARLNAIDSELGADEARRRYHEFARIAEEAEERRSAEGWTPRVEDLDGQISRWRATLSELEHREALVLDRLAGIRPDDASPEIALADQRASIAVALRLIADLESEVARFACTGDSLLCVCRDAHPRLNPLVETLGKHAARIADLIEQQDHALHAQELLEESEQIARSKEELRRQIEKLLERRETLMRTTRARAGRLDQSHANRIDLPALESDRATIADRLATVEAELSRVEGEIADLAHRRRSLYEPAELASWREELAAIEARIGTGQRASSTVRTGAPIRASELLAKLTDGELLELRLVEGGRYCEGRTRRGGVVAQHEFTEQQLRCVVASLRLALADTLAAAGVQTPLVWDEPFYRLDQRTAANLATAIDDFRRRGRQAVIFTSVQFAIDRFRSLGVELRTLRGEIPPTPVPAVEQSSASTRKVVRRESSIYVLDIDDPIDRFPAPIDDRDASFRRAQITTVRELVTADPSDVADALALPDVTAELVSLWQAHTALVCFVPGLTFAEAKSLTAAGVLSVEDLAEADAEALTALFVERGVAWRSSRELGDWIELSSDGVSRWRSSGLSDAWRRNSRERRERINRNLRRRRSSTSRSGSRSTGRTKSESSRRSRSESTTTRCVRRERTAREETTYRYYLEPTDDIEAAPSIGAKMAARLNRLSILRVSDLLEADPEEISSRLEDSRIDAATVVAWQHQAGLVCRVAGLRGHDAQILVACGYTNPEEIATMKPAELLEFVDPFCDGPEAKRILRGSSRPDLAEVTSWIEGARHRRALEAV